MNFSELNNHEEEEKKELPAEIQEQDQYRIQLRGSAEVRALTDEIDLKDTGSIMRFGQKPAEDISRISEDVLSTMRSIKTEEATEMMDQLSRIMEKFDMKDIESLGKQSFFEKLFMKAKEKIDKIFKKYDDMGHEVDGIVQILKRYQDDIQRANLVLDRMYEGNLRQYRTLEQYIVAGQLAQEELEQFKQTVLADVSKTQQDKEMTCKKLDSIKSMLSQRVYDLQVAENVAIQACPMLQMMQESNWNLQRKINSAFIVTLPIFQQCLIQAIQMKRTEIQMRSIKHLDSTTEDLWKRNAQTAAVQSVKMAEMAGSGSLSTETLKESYAIILRGIEETRQMNEQQEKERSVNSAELEKLQNEMKKKGFVP